MKVILLQDVKKYGKKFEVKEAREGYARNFLIPNKLAEAATPESLARLERVKAQTQADHDALVTELKDKAERLAKIRLDFHLKTGAKGEVFGSVTAKQIEHALIGHGFEHVHVELEHPIKEIASRKIEVDLGEGIKTALTVRTAGETKEEKN